MAETLIPLEAVEQLIHVKRTKIYKMIAAGEFPAPGQDRERIALA